MGAVAAGLGASIAQRRAAQISLDFTLALTAWGIAYVARFNIDWVATATYLKPLHIVVAAALQVAAIAVAGNYARLWRYTSLSDLRPLILGVALGAAVVLAIAIASPRHLGIPRGVLLGQPLFLLLMLVGVRVAWRVLYHELRANGRARPTGEPIIVVGAGKSAASLLAEFRSSGRWRAVALLDDDPVKRGRVIQDVRVEGGSDDLARVAARLRVRKAVIAIPSLKPQQHTALARKLSTQGADVYTLLPADPQHADLRAHDAMRRIEPEELLRRTPVALDAAPLRQEIEGKVVLVTGAGGSIGSQLCRQLAELRPQLLVLVELNEFALYQIAEELNEICPSNAVTLVGDVKDEHRMAEVMTRYRPQIVFHAAAYKHVPLLETANAFEAVRNNALGSMVVAQAARSAQVDRLVIVSTDKAVNPTSVMGATKRLAELLVQQTLAGTPVKLSIVRFGNVLGSAGSVIPKFVEQIRLGGPVTVTHPDMTRYFMSIPEAAQLIVHSSAIGRGGEIFVLDMGEPVRIVELAEDLIGLMGKSRQDIDIVFTGLRPGEKLFEELLFDREVCQPTEHPRIRVARASEPGTGLKDSFVAWLHEKPRRSDLEVRLLLQRFVPEFGPAPRADEAATPPASLKIA